MSLILFGGSFDPFHLAHKRLLLAGLRAVDGARMIVLPAYHSPLKAPSRVPAAERLALLRSVLDADLPPAARKRVSIDTFELKRARKTYSFESLRRLRKRHPGRKIYFLCGSDALASLPRWARPGEVARAAAFLVGRRPGSKLPERAPHDASVFVLPGVFPALSSTEIRIKLLLGEPASAVLSDAAIARIQKRDLYGVSFLKRLRAELRPGRFAHTLAVARHAAQTAKRHGLNPEEAALAGLLHDCGRAVLAPHMARFLRRNRIAAPARAETLRREPMLLHAHASAFRARAVYGIDNAAVLSAIRKHTLGDARMSPLDRLLYAADASSADRAYPGVGRIRAALRKSVDAGFREAVRGKLLGIAAQGHWLHPSTPAAYNAAMEPS